MKSLAWLAASAVEDPETPAKSTDSTTLICARLPGRWPTIARVQLNSRSVMPPEFIRLAASRKNGTASSRNELNAVNIVETMTVRSSRGSSASGGTQAIASAKATGMRTSSAPNSTPNISAATNPGVMARSWRNSRTSSTICSPRNSSQPAADTGNATYISAIDISVISDTSVRAS